MAKEVDNSIQTTEAVEAGDKAPAESAALDTSKVGEITSSQNSDLVQTQKAQSDSSSGMSQIKGTEDLQLTGRIEKNEQAPTQAAKSQVETVAEMQVSANEEKVEQQAKPQSEPVERTQAAAQSAEMNSEQLKQEHDQIAQKAEAEEVVHDDINQRADIADRKAAETNEQADRTAEQARRTDAQADATAAEAQNTAEKSAHTEEVAEANKESANAAELEALRTSARAGFNAQAAQETESRCRETGNRTEGEDGVVVYQSADGSSYAVYPDGSTVIINADQSTVRTNAEGRTTEIDNGDNSRVQYDGETTTITNADQTQVVKTESATEVTNSNGSKVTKNADGSTVVKNEDGSSLIEDGQGNSTVINADNSSTLTTADGVTHINADGSSHTINTDGSEFTVNSDGSSRTISTDGSKEMRNADGSSQVTTAQGEVTEHNPDGSSRTTSTDGAVKLTNNDGTSQTTSADGTVTTSLVDGSSRTKSADGTVSTESVDGSTQTKTANGTVTTTLNDGSTVAKFADGTIKTEAVDGSSRTSGADGSVKLEMPDGTTRIVNADGTSSLVPLDGTSPSPINGESGSGEELQIINQNGGVPVPGISGATLPVDALPVVSLPGGVIPNILINGNVPSTAPETNFPAVSAPSNGGGMLPVFTGEFIPAVFNPDFGGFINPLDFSVSDRWANLPSFDLDGSDVIQHISDAVVAPIDAIIDNTSDVLNGIPVIERKPDADLTLPSNSLPTLPQLPTTEEQTAPANIELDQNRGDNVFSYVPASEGSKEPLSIELKPNPEIAWEVSKENDKLFDPNLQVGSPAPTLPPSANNVLLNLGLNTPNQTQNLVNNTFHERTAVKPEAADQETAPRYLYVGDAKVESGSFLTPQQANALLSGSPLFRLDGVPVMDAVGTQDATSPTKNLISLTGLNRTSVSSNSDDTEVETCVIRKIGDKNEFVLIVDALNLVAGEPAFIGQFAVIVGEDGKPVTTPSGILKVRPLTQEEIEAAEAAKRDVVVVDGMPITVSDVLIGAELDLMPEFKAEVLRLTTMEPSLVEVIYAEDGVTPVTEIHFAADGKTVVAITEYDKDGNPIKEIEFKPDGITPDVVTYFRPDGTVAMLVAYGEDGRPISQTDYARDGFTVVSMTKFAEDGMTPVETKIYNPDGTVLSVTNFKDGIKTSTTTFGNDGSVSTVIFAADGKTPVRRIDTGIDGAVKITELIKTDEKAPGVSTKSQTAGPDPSNAQAPLSSADPNQLNNTAAQVNEPSANNQVANANGQNSNLADPGNSQASVDPSNSPVLSTDPSTTPSIDPSAISNAGVITQDPSVPVQNPRVAAQEPSVSAQVSSSAAQEPAVAPAQAPVEQVQSTAPIAAANSAPEVVHSPEREIPFSSIAVNEPSSQIAADLEAVRQFESENEIEYPVFIPTIDRIDVIDVPAEVPSLVISQTPANVEEAVELVGDLLSHILDEPVLPNHQSIESLIEQAVIEQLYVEPMNFGIYSEQPKDECTQREENEEKSKQYAVKLIEELDNRKGKKDLAPAKEQKEPPKAESRQCYIVRQGDTLESIAEKRLFNKNLAPLLYQINASRIPSRVKDGRRVLQLKPRVMLLLPTAIEIRNYLSRLFGKSHLKFAYDSDNTQNQISEMITHTLPVPSSRRVFTSRTA